jgi:hypothetical protein
MMRLVLFTTTDLRSGREADFLRMIEAVRSGAGADVPFRMFALLQRCNEDARARWENRLPAGSVVLASPDRISLSEARNRLLDAAQKCAALTPDCVVGFPDDDCWYPPRFVRQLAAAFERDPQLDMLSCRVSLAPVVPISIEVKFMNAKAWQVVRRSSSNSIFVRGATAAAIGEFDRTLGLGTPNGSGEDTDYALRALLAARKAVFVDLPMVGHRASDVASVARYYKGALIVLGRYALQSPELLFKYVRKLAVGAYLVLRSHLSLREYFISIGNGLRELHGSMHSARKGADVPPVVVPQSDGLGRHPG